MLARTISFCLTVALAGGFGLSAHAAVTERVCLLQVDIELSECASAGDAVAACSAALSRQPADFNARVSLCEAYVAADDPAAAIEILEAGRSVHRGDPFTLGLIDRVLSNVTEAQSAGQKHNADVGTLVEYMVLRCTMVRNLQNCDEALAIDPDNVQALSGRGDILVSQGDLGGAIAAYRRSLDLNPGQPEVTAKLDAALAERGQQVDTCLAATAPSGIAGCRALVIPGEADTPDLFGKIGSLELAAGNLKQALAAYNDAEAAGSSSESRAMTGLLTLALGCIDSGAADACSRAIDSVPQSRQFRRVRAAVMLSGCRTAVRSADSPALDATAICNEARTLDTSAATAQEVDRLLASLAPPALETPPVADDRPADSLTQLCLERYAEIGADETVADLCERAARNEANAARAADVVAALAAIRGRREAVRGVAECEAAAAEQSPSYAIDICRRLAGAAPDEGSRNRLEALVAGLEFQLQAESCNAGGYDTAAAACARALALAPGDADRLTIQRRIEQIEQQQSNRQALAALKDRCINFASAALGAALSDCTSAAERMPADDEVQKALRTVETLAAAYRNEPIIWVQGNEAVTY